LIYAESADFEALYKTLHNKYLMGYAYRSHANTWQGLDVTETTDYIPWCLFDVSLEIMIPTFLNEWQDRVKPNLPWAEDHFGERVSGIPYNPPPSNENWPYAQAANAEFKNGGKFSHTYPERMWPKMANEATTRPNGRQVFVPHNGIRFEYGDLQDVVELLRRDPLTRQAFLPIWFPEDTGAHHGERVPCTLGYLFRVHPIDSSIDVIYYIRSCDFRRHFRDDVYMAGRLSHWMATQLTEVPGTHYSTGKLVMHIANLHVFEGDLPLMKAEYNDRLNGAF